MVILVSNDDGIRSRGIEALAQALKPFGRVVVVAPDREQSGSSHSLTLHRPLRIFPVGEDRYMVDGTPTDCVNLGILEILKDETPALVVSGINHGANLGDDVTYSGTVSAALEGTILGVPAIAFSLVSENYMTADFTIPMRVVSEVVQKVLHHRLPKGTLLNVNIPDFFPDETHIQYQVTRLGSRRYAGAAVEKIDPKGRKYYWIGGEEMDFDQVEGTDSNAVRQKRVSVSPIRLDMTAHGFIEELKTWTFS